MSIHPPSSRFGAVALSLVLTTGGCQPDAVNTTTPSATPGPAQGVANPEAARAHLNAVLSTMQTNSINRDTIDWASFRTEVLAAAGEPRTLADVHPAILTAATRSFGTPTCGHHHLQHSFPFTDGTLFLVTNQHADRQKRRYAGSITPDELVTDANETVARSVVWLHDGR